MVKLELEELQREWVSQPGILLVANSYSVVILSNRPAWRFRAIDDLSEQARAELVEVRKYAEQALPPLPSKLRRVDGPDGSRDYLWQRQSLDDEGWTLHLLHEPRPPLVVYVLSD